MPDPITPARAARILYKASTVDSRDPDAGADEMWAEILTRAGVDYRDALAAVAVHYARSTTRLMPGHVIDIAREFAAQRNADEANRRALDAVAERPGVVHGEAGMARIRRMIVDAKLRAARKEAEERAARDAERRADLERRGRLSAEIEEAGRRLLHEEDA